MPLSIAAAAPYEMQQIQAGSDSAALSTLQALQLIWSHLSGDLLMVTFFVVSFGILRGLTPRRFFRSPDFLQSTKKCSPGPMAPRRAAVEEKVAAPAPAGEGEGPSAGAGPRPAASPRGPTPQARPACPSPAHSVGSSGAVAVTPAGPKTPSDRFAEEVSGRLAANDLPAAAAAFSAAGEELQNFASAPASLASVIKACANRQEVQLAFDLYQQARHSLECNRATYHSLIVLLMRQGEGDKAEQVLRDMTLENVMPDLATFSVLIRGHVARGDLERALQLLGIMQRRDVKPDLALFHSVLECCGKKQSLPLTEHILADMIRAGVSPSGATLATLVRLYGQCGELGAAVKVVNTYPAKYGFQLTAQVFSCLISACVANHDLPQAFQVYDRMCQAGCSADAATFQALLAGCLQENDLDCGATIVEAVLAKGQTAALLNRESVELLLLRCGQQERPDLAGPLLTRLQQVSFVINKRVVDIVRNAERAASCRPAATIAAPPGLEEAISVSAKARTAAAIEAARAGITLEG